MNMRQIILSLALAISSSAALSAQAADREYKVQFKKNTSSATYKGKIKGYDSNDYTFYAKAGQKLNVKVKGDVIVNLFHEDFEDSVNLGESSPALDDNGNYVLPTTGSYKIRVGQMRAMARRDRVVNYNLKITIR